MKLAALLASAAILAASASAAALLTRPDPATQAVADGCARDLAGIFKREVPTWAYVNDRGSPAEGPPPPPQWVRGVARSPVQDLGVHPAGVDDPVTHDSYDVLVNVQPDPAFAALLGGSEAAKTGNFEGEGETTGVLHTEWEQRALPFFAWPDEGDRVTMLGSWVWDCGHWDPGGERTELHPLRALWVERRPAAGGSGPSPRSPYGEAEGDLLVSTVKTFAGVEADCAHHAKASRIGFLQCIAGEPDWQDVSGDYRFRLAAPPKPAPGARLVHRVVDAGSTAGAPALTVTPGSRGVDVSVHVGATSGRKLVLAKQVFVGWTPLPAAKLPEHLRVSLRSLLVRRAMDPGCPGGVACASVESTRYDQVTTAPGEWTLYWDVGGIWGMWSPPVLRVEDGDVVRGRQAVDLYVPRGAGWRLFTYARECDFTQLSPSNPQAPPWPCPKGSEFGGRVGDDDPGSVSDRYASAGASLGPHASNASLAGSSCPRENTKGCYALTYEVTRIDDAAARAAAKR